MKVVMIIILLLIIPSLAIDSKSMMINKCNNVNRNTWIVFLSFLSWYRHQKWLIHFFSCQHRPQGINSRSCKKKKTPDRRLPGHLRCHHLESGDVLGTRFTRRFGMVCFELLWWNLKLANRIEPGTRVSRRGGKSYNVSNKWKLPY